MTSLPPGPHRRSYWIVADKFCAGAYPGAPAPAAAEEKLRKLLDAGVRTFINLMEEDEADYHGELFSPYAPIVSSLADRYDGESACLRFSIRDLSVPTLSRMRDIQAAIDRSIADGKSVYLHCWGGKGRTGTVVGIWLIRNGHASVDDFVDVIRRLRINDAGGGESPETAEQRGFVRDFVENG